MAHPTQLNPTEQDALVKQIGLALLRAAPQDWEQIVIDYRAVGRHQESAGQIVTDGGEARPWRISGDVATLFAKLRAGMYREGRGTWFNARYQLDRPTSYNLEYDRDEPTWDAPPPPQAYADELRIFPRQEENVPEWLVRRLAGVGPERPGPHFRTARAFDGMGQSGRPVVNRPPVDDEDRDDLLAYLDRAPVIIPGRGFDVDRLDADGRQSVPVAFHSDGTWIWPAAVNYYLRKYRVPPEPDLVEHIRSLSFTVPDVDEATKAAAAGFLDRAPRPVPPPGAAVPPGPPGSAAAQPARPPARSAPVPPPAAPTVVAPVPTPGSPPVSPPLAPPPGPGRPPAAALPSQGGPGPALGQLTAKLAEYGVPESVVRIGPPVENTWTLERTDEGWRVGFFQRGEFVAPARFEDVADAAAFLLGKVLLDTGWQRPARPPRLPQQQFQPEERFQPAAEEAVTAEPEAEPEPFRPIERFVPLTMDGAEQSEPAQPTIVDAEPADDEPPATPYESQERFGRTEAGADEGRPATESGEPFGGERRFPLDDPEDRFQPAEPAGEDQPEQRFQSVEATGADKPFPSLAGFPPDQATGADKPFPSGDRFSAGEATSTDEPYQPADGFRSDEATGSDEPFRSEDGFPAADSAGTDEPFQSPEHFRSSEAFRPGGFSSGEATDLDEPSRSSDRFGSVTDEPLPSGDRFPSDEATGTDEPFQPPERFGSGTDEPFRSGDRFRNEDTADSYRGGDHVQPSEDAGDDQAFSSGEHFRSAPAEAADQPIPAEQRFRHEDTAAPTHSGGLFPTAPPADDDQLFQPSSTAFGHDDSGEPFRPASDHDHDRDDDQVESAAQAEEPVRPAQQFRPEERFQPGFGHDDAADSFLPPAEVDDDHLDAPAAGGASQSEDPFQPTQQFRPEERFQPGRGFGHADPDDDEPVRPAAELDDEHPEPAATEQASRTGEPFQSTQQFRPEERFQPKFDHGEPEPSPADEPLPEPIEDTGPAVIEADPATLAGLAEEPELLTHHDEPHEPLEQPARDELESTQVHHPFDDETDDEPDIETEAPAQPRRADLPARGEESTMDRGPSGLGGAGLFAPTVPVDSPPPRSAPRSLRRRPQQEPAELFTPTPPVNGRSVEEPAESGAPQQETRPASKPAGGQPWPIKPMDGEPPLTLFRHKEMRELSPGTELDRYGDPDGNLTYMVSTPFEQRSLVPDWVDRPYHAYRVTRPLEVLAGVAIPWFDQPGGGTAYLLPDSVGGLIDAGYLVEVDDAKPPH